MKQPDPSPRPDAPQGARPAGSPAPGAQPAGENKPAQKNEIGGPAWPEPTRYGDWERGGRVSDF